MRVYRFIFFLSSLLLASMESAATGDRCSPEKKPLQSLIIPPMIAYELLRPERSSESVFLPLPPGVCVSKGQRIRLNETSEKMIGVLEIQDHWEGKISDTAIAIDLHSKKQSLLARYAQSYQSFGWLPAQTSDVLLKLLSDYYDFDKKRRVTLIAASLALDPRYYSTWTPHSHLDESSFAKTIDFQELVRLMRDQEALVIDARPDVDLNENSQWRIPSATAASDLTPLLSTVNFGLSALTSSSMNIKIGSLEEDVFDQHVVVYSHLDDFSPATNVLNWFYLKNFKKLYWFKDGINGWTGQDKKEKALQGARKILRADEYLQLKKSSEPVLIDVRDPYDYQLGHIPGALPISKQLLSGAKIKEILGPLRKTYQKQLKDHETYPFMALHKVSAGKKPIVIYGRSENDFYAQEAYDYFARRSKEHLFLLEGGYAIWYARHIWQGKAQSYEVESATPELQTNQPSDLNQ